MKVFSGIQPSGILHIGNYLGAIKQWVELQKTHDCIYCIVDLHAITVPQDPKELPKNILSTVAVYLAAGVDPEKSVIFVQSSRPEHTELAWILATQTNMGELSRMTQYKEKGKGERVKGKVGAGLFVYPTLMAADILLYQTDLVPVGEDQVQHIELTRDLALRFNKRFGEVFKLPQALLQKEGARIMGLDNPQAKMSKSASPSNYIALTDPKDVIREKIQKAVTDSGKDIKAGPEKPAMTNLLNIYSGVTHSINSGQAQKSVKELEKAYQGKGYQKFKEDLAEVLIDFLEPLQTKINSYLKEPAELTKILKEGSEKIAPEAQQTLQLVKKKVGLWL